MAIVRNKTVCENGALKENSMAIKADGSLKKLDSYFIKTALIHYWRFDKQCIAVDEYSNIDIAVITNGNYFIDCEVKISKSDLLNDFKKDKHFLYKNGYSEWCDRFPGLQKYPDSLELVPNRFYFVVPVELKDIAIKEAARLNSNYGVLSIQATSLDLRYGYNQFSIYTEKNAKHLHHTPINTNKLLWQIGKRASAKLRIIYGEGGNNNDLQSQDPSGNV